MYICVHLHVHACVSVYCYLSVCVSHGWVLVQAEASQWAEACLINSSDRYEELKDFSPLSTPASQTLTHTDWQGPAGTTCYRCLDFGVWAVDSTIHTHSGFMLILRCDYLLRSPDTCIMHLSFLLAVNWCYDNMIQAMSWLIGEVHLVMLANLTYGKRSHQSLTAHLSYNWGWRWTKRTSAVWVAGKWHSKKYCGFTVKHQPVVFYIQSEQKAHTTLIWISK